MEETQLKALARTAFEVHRKCFPGSNWNENALWNAVNGHDWTGITYTAAVVAMTLGAQDPSIKTPKGLFFMDRPHWSKAAAETGETDTVPVIRCRDFNHDPDKCHSPNYTQCRSEILAGHRPESKKGADYWPLDTPPSRPTSLSRRRKATEKARPITNPNHKQTQSLSREWHPAKPGEWA